MADKEKLATVENTLLQRYYERGYLLEDEVIDCCVDYDLDLAEIEAVCDRLLKRSIILRDSDINIVVSSDDVEEVYDRSHTDYDELYNIIIKEHPSSKHLVEQIKKILPPQHKECRTLLGEAKNGNKYACQRLILMYSRTILKRAYDFSKTYHCDFEDCFQNGVIGFITAIKKFDITSPENFLSYFQWWVIQSMSREYTLKGTVMRYPTHYNDKLMSIVNLMNKENMDIDDVAIMEQKMIEEYSLSGDYEGIYEYLDKKYALVYREEYVNLIDKKIDYNHLLPYRQIFDDIENEDNVEDYCIEMDKRKRIREIVFRRLNSRELDVIIKRYGLYDDRSMTLEEIGEIYGITRERVRQIEAKAFNKLKKSFEKIYADYS